MVHGHPHPHTVLLLNKQRRAASLEEALDDPAVGGPGGSGASFAPGGTALSTGRRPSPTGSSEPR